MLAGEPDSFSWPRSNTSVSESSDGGSAARAAPRHMLNKPQAQLLRQAGWCNLCCPWRPHNLTAPSLKLTLKCQAWFVQGSNL
jgi:hypothetical protein